MITPPYPADIHPKGWMLPLDYERIEQSDTWAIASPEQRPWLLMLWLTAWRQVPVASLPEKDLLIAARIGMPLEQFIQWKEILLSGWELATDGRLYHKTLTEHVLGMSEKRVKDRERVAEYRAKLKNKSVSNTEKDTCNTLHDTNTDDVTRYTDVTHSEVARDQCVSSTPEPEPEPIKPTRTNAHEAESYFPAHENGTTRTTHPDDWKPDCDRLNHVLRMAGQSPPENLSAMMVEFNLHYAGKQFTENQRYQKLIAWLKREKPYDKTNSGATTRKPKGFEYGDAIGAEWLRKEREREQLEQQGQSDDAIGRWT